MKDINKKILEIKLKDNQSQEDKLKIQKMQQELDFLRNKSKDQRLDIPDIGYEEWLEFKDRENSEE